VRRSVVQNGRYVPASNVTVVKPRPPSYVNVGQQWAIWSLPAGDFLPITVTRVLIYLSY